MESVTFNTLLYNLILLWGSIKLLELISRVILRIAKKSKISFEKSVSKYAVD